MAAFLANVGVNAAHRVRSPLHEDGSFELFPIPELMPWAPPMLRLPPVWGDRAVHHDPDLTGAPPTYGDNCRTAGRAFSLRRARPGDLICFLARLHPAEGAPAFHLVGVLRVAEVLADVDRDPGPGWWEGNAHVRRSRAGAPWDRFWVFAGGPGSRLLPRARRFGRTQCEAVFGAGAWLWRGHRSELQTIGSYTRAVRRLEGSGEDALRAMCS